MASIFAHALTGFTAGRFLQPNTDLKKFYFLAILCTVLPDADVISFSFGIPYSHWLGHRGFTHSFAFALIIGVTIKFLFYRSTDAFNSNGIKTVLFFTLLTSSHGVMDAMTTGGEGIAFFWPFINDRYFLPWRVIKVSPIGAANFHGARAISVLVSEFLFIGIPCLLMLLLNYISKLRSKKA